jgi:hypothetical protein
VQGFHKNYFQRDGIQWNTIHMYSSLKAVQMMIKPSTDAASLLTTTASSPGLEAAKTAKATGKKRKGRSKSREGRKKD